MTSSREPRARGTTVPPELPVVPAVDRAAAVAAVGPHSYRDTVDGSKKMGEVDLGGMTG